MLSDANGENELVVYKLSLFPRREDYRFETIRVFNVLESKFSNGWTLVNKHAVVFFQLTPKRKITCIKYSLLEMEELRFVLSDCDKVCVKFSIHIAVFTLSSGQRAENSA